jgi:hypothetical protein
VDEAVEIEAVTEVVGTEAGSEEVTEADSEEVTEEDTEAETEAVVGSAPPEVEALEVEAAAAGKIIIIQPTSVHSTSFSIFSPSGGGQPQLDARLTDRSEDALVASLRSLTLQGDEIPLRPGFGTLGRPITLRTNFFPVRIPKGPIYEYDIAITPVAGTANRRVKRRIFQLAEQTNDWASAGLRGTVAHDHSAKLVSAKKLKQPLTIRVPWSEEGEPPNGREYALAIKFVQNIDTSALSQYVPRCVLPNIQLIDDLKLRSWTTSVQRLRYHAHLVCFEFGSCSTSH